MGHFLFSTSMKSNKQSRSIEEQIDILRDKGLVIGDMDFARQSLSRISYYRLKGYWWGLQEEVKDRSRVFLSDATFEEVIRRYQFDKELRPILFDAIETIEIALRTSMIYHMSQAHTGLWYRYQSLFHNPTLHQEHLDALDKEFLRSREIFAQAYHKEHGEVISDKPKTIKLSSDPDAWVIFEVATLGTLSKMYKNIHHQLPEKAKIANQFGHNFHNEFSGWLEALVYLRNIVAHHSRIFERNMVKTPALISTQRDWITLPLTEEVQEVQTKKAYLIITSMLYLCNAIGDGGVFKQKMIDLLDRYPEYKHKIGFVGGWRAEPIWRE